MALSEVTISLNLADKVGDLFDARRTKAWVTTTADVVHDTEGHATRVGTGQGTVGTDGIVTWDVWTPGTGSNPASWQTTFHVDCPDRNAPKGRKTLSFGPFTVTAAAWIDQLVTEMEVPPETLGGDAWLAAIDADDASQYRQQQDARLLATYVARGDLAIDISDARYRRGTVMDGATIVGYVVDLELAIADMEALGGYIYIPPGDWYPETWNIPLDETNVPTTYSTALPRIFTYKFVGAGRQSRLRLPAGMTSADYLLIANSTDSNTFYTHPKVIFEDFAVAGIAGSSDLGNFFLSHQRSFRATRVYLAVMRTGFYADGYCDLIHLDQVYAEAMTTTDPNGWVFQGVENGDGVVIRQLFAYGTQGISLRGAYGAVVESCISGFHEFILCGVQLRNNHMEGDGSTVATPVLTFKGCEARISGGLYQTKPFRSTVKVDDSVSSVAATRLTIDSDVVFACRVDDPGSSYGNVRGVDLDVADLDEAGVVNIDGAHSAMYAQSTALASAGNGFGTIGRFALNVISSATVAIQTAITAGKAFLGDPCTIRYYTGAWELGLARPAHGLLFTKSIPQTYCNVINGSAYESVMTSDLAAGTYYYRAWVVDQAGRVTQAAAEGSITATVADPLVGLTIQTYEAPVRLRVLRGTAAGVYTHWCEVVLANPRQNLVDQGSSLSGIAWSTVSVPAVSVTNETRRGYKRLDNGQSVFQANAAPTTGTWQVNDRVEMATPVAGGPSGWVCVTAGTPGTWKAMPNLAV